MGVFLWLMFAVAVGVWASNRGRSGIGWFFVSCLLSPLLGAIFVAVSANLAQPGGGATVTEATHLRCTACAEWVLPAANKCKHCGATLAPDPTYVQRQRDTAKAAERANAINTLTGLAVVATLIAIFLWATK